MFGKPIILVVIVFILISVSGCQNAPAVGLVQDVNKIELLQEEGFQVNKPVAKTFSGEEQIEAIVKAIKASTKIDGILDVTEPPFTLKLYYENDETKTYHLWVEKAGINYYGMIMDVEDTHTGYKLSEESVKVLLELAE